MTQLIGQFLDGKSLRDVSAVQTDDALLINEFVVVDNELLRSFLHSSSVLAALVVVTTTTSG